MKGNAPMDTAAVLVIAGFPARLPAGPVRTLVDAVECVLWRTSRTLLDHLALNRLGESCGFAKRDLVTEEVMLE